MSDVPTRRYLMLNLIGAAVWAAAVAYLGYALGEAAEALLGQIHRYELAIFAAIAGLGAILWGVHFARRRRQRSRILEQCGSDARTVGAEVFARTSLTRPARRSCLSRRRSRRRIAGQRRGCSRRARA